MPVRFAFQALGRAASVFAGSLRVISAAHPTGPRQHRALPRVTGWHRSPTAVTGSRATRTPDHMTAGSFLVYVARGPSEQAAGGSAQSVALRFWVVTIVIKG